MKTRAIFALLAFSIGSAIAANVFAEEVKAPAKTDATQSQQDWPVYGGTAENNHYSSLKQINRNNVRQLAIAWSFDTEEPGGLQTSPIVVDGDAVRADADAESVRARRRHRQTFVEV